MLRKLSISLNFMRLLIIITAHDSTPYGMIFVSFVDINLFDWTENCGEYAL